MKRFEFTYSENTVEIQYHEGMYEGKTMIKRQIAK